MQCLFVPVTSIDWSCKQLHFEALWLAYWRPAEAGIPPYSIWYSLPFQLWTFWSKEFQMSPSCVETGVCTSVSHSACCFWVVSKGREKWLHSSVSKLEAQIKFYTQITMAQTLLAYFLTLQLPILLSESIPQLFLAQEKPKNTSCVCSPQSMPPTLPNNAFPVFSTAIHCPQRCFKKPSLHLCKGGSCAIPKVRMLPPKTKFHTVSFFLPISSNYMKPIPKGLLCWKQKISPENWGSHS